MLKKFYDAGVIPTADSAERLGKVSIPVRFSNRTAFYIYLQTFRFRPLVLLEDGFPWL